MRTARPQRGRIGAPLGWRWPVLLVVIAVVAVVALTRGGTSAPAPHRLESMFQDDAVLIDTKSTPQVLDALETLKALGVDRLRLQITWQQIAPDPGSRTPPKHFDPTNPASYPGWGPYDRIDLLAARHGIAVDFDVSDPAPLWATRRGIPAKTVPGDHAPSAKEFGEFVTAVGRRYSGTYKIVFTPGSPPMPLPRVSFWTIWNEPNQPGWLSPQYRTFHHRRVLAAPALYRSYVDAAWAALHATGHGKDRILVGELAPEGCPPSGENPICHLYRRSERPVTPLPFLQALYCVGPAYERLQGVAATALRCPASGTAAAFVRANPGLFAASAFTHHPYNLDLPPGTTDASEPTFVPLSDLGRLEQGLDRAFAAYGSHRRIPIYLDEYGYNTNPPNGRSGVPPAYQAAYLNQATYMAWKDPRVQGLSQFELVDSSTAMPGAFQTGLEFAGGRRKPSFAAYRLPIFLPHPSVVAGTGVLVWAMLRAAPNGTTQRALIQWRANGAGAFRTMAHVSTSDPDGVFQARVTVPSTGEIRVSWTDPAGHVELSRAAPVTVTIG